MEYTVIVRLHYGGDQESDLWTTVYENTTFQTLLDELLRKCLIKDHSRVYVSRHCVYTLVDESDLVYLDFSSSTCNGHVLDLFVGCNDLNIVDSVITFTTSL